MRDSQCSTFSATCSRRTCQPCPTHSTNAPFLPTSMDASLLPATSRYVSLTLRETSRETSDCRLTLSCLSETLPDTSSDLSGPFTVNQSGALCTNPRYSSSSLSFSERLTDYVTHPPSSSRLSEAAFEASKWYQGIPSSNKMLRPISHDTRTRHRSTRE